MHKIALFPTMLLLPYVSFAGLLSSNNSTTPISKKYKQQLIDPPVYIQIFKEEQTLDLHVKMGEQYQLFDGYKICNYSGGLGPKQRQNDFKSPGGFYSVQRGQLKPDSRFYKAVNIDFPSAHDYAHGYEGKYLMIHGVCVSIDCYTMTGNGIDKIFQFVTDVLVFEQSSVQVSVYLFRMTDVNMQRRKFSCYKDFWAQLKPRYDYFEQTRKPPTISVVNGRYIVSRPLGHEVVQPQLASNYMLLETK